MTELLCIAGGALLVSLWWLRRMRRAVLAWQAYAKELQRQNNDGTRLLRQTSSQVVLLAGQLRQLGHEPAQLAQPERQNGRRKGATPR
jgi:hypothetical protein